jgi:hypothetical protein
MRVDLLVHITAGAVALLSGFIALFVAKGERAHRKSGMVFAAAMLVMALMGSLMAIFRNVAPGANGPVGVLTTYLVVTGLATVRPSLASRRLDIAMLIVVLATTVTLATFSILVLVSPTGRLYGMPAFPFIAFAAIGSLAIRGDIRFISAGGAGQMRGIPRLRRHLWRMSTALLIAAFSFFLGQAKVIPKPIRIFPLLLIPPLVVLASLVYWLWRVRSKRALNHSLDSVVRRFRVAQS